MKKRSYPQRIKSSIFLLIGCGKPDDISNALWIEKKMSEIRKCTGNKDNLPFDPEVLFNSLKESSAYGRIFTQSIF